MSPKILLRRLGATCLTALAAGCATSPDVPSAIGRVTQLDLGAKWSMPDREKGKRDRARVSAQYHLEMEADEKGPPTAEQVFRAHHQRDAIAAATALLPRPKSAGMQPSQWQTLGPSNVGGRVRALAFDPRSPNRLLAGTASGGLWISDNAGDSWRANHDFLPNLSVSTIVFDPASPNNVYLGTGEASAGLVGVGAFKSTDGGETWRFIDATNADANPDWRFVNRLAIHPTQTQVLLAALTNNDFARGAIYRSTDGGASWTRVNPPSNAGATAMTSE